MRIYGTFFSHLFYICLLQVRFPKPANRAQEVVLRVCTSNLVWLAVCREKEPKTFRPLLNRSDPTWFFQKYFLHEGFSPSWT